MATITATTEGQQDRSIFWETLTENDTATGADWPGGEGFVSVYGTFGGATVNVQISVDGGTTYFTPDTGTPPDGVAFTANGIVKFDWPSCLIKPVASGGTSQDVDVKVQPKKYV